MRSLSMVSLFAALALSACDAAQEITAPEVPEPRSSFHIVPSGTPDGDYSMYYFDLNLTHDLLMKIAQTFQAETEVTMCPGNDDPHPSTGNPPTHNVDGDELPFPGWGLPTASGYGSFVYRDGWRRTRGSLFVTGACWFDEWNDEKGDGGFPESAWVTGWAFVGWRFRPFKLMLQSRGFPAPNHLVALDRAVLEIIGRSDLGLDLLGEIHHEDGTTLVQ